MSGSRIPNPRTKQSVTNMVTICDFSCDVSSNVRKLFGGSSLSFLKMNRPQRKQKSDLKLEYLHYVTPWGSSDRSVTSSEHLPGRWRSPLSSNSVALYDHSLRPHCDAHKAAQSTRRANCSLEFFEDFETNYPLSRNSEEARVCVSDRTKKRGHLISVCRFPTFI